MSRPDPALRRAAQALDPAAAGVEYFYVIAFVGMMSSDHRRRFGDRWGQTFVIRS